MHKDYLQRPDKLDHNQKPNGDDDRDGEEDEDNQHGGNRNKTPLYKKPLRDIKKFPFMANKQTGDEIEEESEEDDRPEPRPAKGLKKDVFAADLNVSGGFDF